MQLKVGSNTIISAINALAKFAGNKLTECCRMLFKNSGTIGLRADDMSTLLGVQDDKVIMKINDNRHPVIITCEDTEKYPAIGVIIPAIIR